MVNAVSPKLKIASWPGRSDSHNSFITVFLDGLEANGCQIENLETVEDVGDAMTGHPDIVFLHWAERVFGESRSRRQVLVKVWRLLRAVDKAPPATRVVWVVHNLAPHDARRFQRLIWPFFIRSLSRKIDAFLTLAPGTVAQVKAAFPGLATKPGHGAWHPAYPNAELSQSARIAARAKMSFAPEHRVLGYCGQIRPYKGVTELLDAFTDTTDPDLRLLLCGRPQYHAPGTKAFLSVLKDKAQDDSRVRLWFDDLTHAQYREALGVCDVIVAPFRSYLHSGSIVHALSANRPVLTPATPFADSFKSLLGAQWVRQYQDGLSPQLLMQQQGVSETVNLTHLSPNAVGKDILTFLNRNQDAQR
ncbi:glycosyltransferase [Rhodobacteraceae bacterium KMM 6894]|nr:glycosyltransferase [Rhodobacteraceae bacterium KMM 6894]